MVFSIKSGHKFLFKLTIDFFQIGVVMITQLAVLTQFKQLEDIKKIDQQSF